MHQSDSNPGLVTHNPQDWLWRDSIALAMKRTSSRSNPQSTQKPRRWSWNIIETSLYARLHNFLHTSFSWAMGLCLVRHWQLLSSHISTSSKLSDIWCLIYKSNVQQVHSTRFPWISLKSISVTGHIDTCPPDHFLFQDFRNIVCLPRRRTLSAMGKYRFLGENELS